MTFVEQREIPDCMACGREMATYRFCIGDCEIEGFVETEEEKPRRLHMTRQGDLYVCDKCREMISTVTLGEWANWLVDNAVGAPGDWIHHWDTPYQATGALMG